MKPFARSVLVARAARFSAATTFLILLLWLVAHAQNAASVDGTIDASLDCWPDNVNTDSVSRAVIYWGERRYTEGDTYSSSGPAWWLGAEKLSGEWTNCSWHVPASEGHDAAWARIYLDRGLLTNDVMMDVLLFDHTNATLFVDLLDSNEVTVVTNLYDNLLAGSNETVEVQVVVPLTNHPTASTIQLRRGAGEITLYRSVLTEDQEMGGLPSAKQTQQGSSPQDTANNRNPFHIDEARLANAQGIDSKSEINRGSGQHELLEATTTLYVDSILGDNSFNGLSPVYADGNGPKRNIYAAIDVADNGANIEIASGSYGETNWDPDTKSLALLPAENVAVFGTTDSDGDGMPDWWESAYGLDPNNSNDASQASTNAWTHGLTNLQVYQHPSVLKEDNYSTLGDGIPDWWRIRYFSRPTDPESGPGGDPDNDNVNNSTEYLRGTNPNNPDTDGDGLPDGVDADPLSFDHASPSFTVTYPVTGTRVYP